MIDTERAYLAGLIDGEGSIGFVVKVKKGLHTTFVLEVTNTCPRMIAWLHEHVGGNSSYRHRNDAEKRRNERDYRRWRLTGRAVDELLLQLMPFLVTKKAHAKVILAYANTIGKSGYSTTPETKTRRAELRERLRTLNQKGRRIATQHVMTD